MKLNQDGTALSFTFLPGLPASPARLIPALAALLLVSGCASVTRGTKDTLVVESDPAGATVRLSTGGIGTTPTSFQLPRKKALDVFVEKEGYEPLTIHVSSQISGTGAAGMAGNVLVGGVIGVGVDAWTGATKDLRPNPIKVVLVPRKTDAKAAQTAEAAPAGPKPVEPVTKGSPEAVANGAQPAASAGSPARNAYQPAGTQVGTLRVPNKMEPSQVQNTIATVLLNREWQVTEKADGHVVGHIKHRSHEAVLTLVYDHDLIQLYCEGWKIDKETGAHLKPDLPDGWIENIRNDLTERLAQAPAAHSPDLVANPRAEPKGSGAAKGT